MLRPAEAKSSAKDCDVNHGKTVDDAIVAIERDGQMTNAGVRLWI